MDISNLIHWIKEREAVRMRKAVLEDAAETGTFQLSKAGRQAWGAGVPTKANAAGERFWSLNYLTHDYILRDYRFCNVRREDDRVTRWIREHIIVPYWTHPNLWLMLCIARTINWPETLAELMLGRRSWPWFDDFSPAIMGETLQARKDRGAKVYTGAYMIRAESHKEVAWYSWPKQRYIAEIVIGRLWEDRELFGNLEDAGELGQSIWYMLTTYMGWGPFMAGQVVTDLKHTRYLQNCPDFNTWTALGPGSTRGLNRLHDRPVGKAINQAQGLEEMIALKERLDQPGAIWPWLQPMELSDVQNCLCEYDKWCRVRLNQGKPRARYIPGRGY